MKPKTSWQFTANYDTLDIPRVLREGREVGSSVVKIGISTPNGHLEVLFVLEGSIEGQVLNRLLPGYSCPRMEGMAREVHLYMDRDGIQASHSNPPEGVGILWRYTTDPESISKTLSILAKAQQERRRKRQVTVKVY